MGPHINFKETYDTQTRSTIHPPSSAKQQKYMRYIPHTAIFAPLPITKQRVNKDTNLTIAFCLSPFPFSVCR